MKILQTSRKFTKYLTLNCIGVNKGMWKKSAWVCEKLGISQPTVRTWAKQGRFNKVLTLPSGQMEYWSTTEDGSDLFKGEELDLREMDDDILED